METEFTSLDLMLIDKEVARKSYEDIAFLLDKPVDVVTSFVDQYLKDKSVVSYQQILDERRPSRPPKPPKVARPPKEQKAARAARENKPKEPKIISRIIERHKPGANYVRRPPNYKTRQIDYSKLKTVRVDEKTVVYARLDEDPEEVRIRWQKVMKKNSALKPMETYYTRKKKTIEPE